MKHPITQKIKYLLIYAAIWLVILGIHTSTLHLLYNVSLGRALIDGIVFDGVFALLGIALWYPVFYNDIEKQSFINLLINHLSIMSLTLAFWISASVFILKSIFPETDMYLNSMNNGIAWRVFTGTFFYFALIMIYYLLIYGYNLREHIMEEAKLKQKVNEAELKTLKSQINPHFLFNSLNSISSLTITNPEKAHEMIIKLSSFLRYSLAHDPNNLIPLIQEIENMEAYISVEKIRFGDKLIFESNISEHCGKTKVPFMILQPLIENAIKHGVYEATSPIKVSVRCDKLDEKNMILTIGNEFDPEAISQKGTGTGIKNIKERLKIIYQINHLLSCEKTENYFKVTLVLPNKPAFRKKLDA
ncbi:MAG: histidine kinase [Salinivirgaceae bacterium]|nr:histidine kinase [Salinivirgaceae bacterium]